MESTVTVNTEFDFAKSFRKDNDNFMMRRKMNTTKIKMNLNIGLTMLKIPLDPNILKYT